MNKFLIAVITLLLLASTAFASDVTKVNLLGTNTVQTQIFKNIPQARVTLLSSDVSKKAADAIISDLKAFSKLSKAPAYLVINSQGGSVEEGMKIIRVIRSIKAQTGMPTYCIVEGNALSMAAVIMTFCHKTYVHKDSLIMFHEGGYSIGGTVSEVPIRIKAINDYIEAVDRMLADQLGITYQKYSELRKLEYWLVGEQAVRYGFADGITENFYYTKEPVKQSMFELIFQYWRL